MPFHPKHLESHVRQRDVFAFSQYRQLLSDCFDELIALAYGILYKPSSKNNPQRTPTMPQLFKANTEFLKSLRIYKANSTNWQLSCVLRGILVFSDPCHARDCHTRLYLSPFCNVRQFHFRGSQQRVTERVDSTPKPTAFLAFSHLTFTHVGLGFGSDRPNNSKAHSNSPNTA